MAESRLVLLTQDPTLPQVLPLVFEQVYCLSPGTSPAPDDAPIWVDGTLPELTIIAAVESLLETGGEAPILVVCPSGSVRRRMRARFAMRSRLRVMEPPPLLALREVLYPSQPWPEETILPSPLLAALRALESTEPVTMDGHSARVAEEARRLTLAGPEPALGDLAWRLGWLHDLVRASVPCTALWQAAQSGLDDAQARALGLSVLSGIGSLTRGEGHFYSLVWCADLAGTSLPEIPVPLARAVAVADLDDLLARGALGKPAMSSREISTFLRCCAPVSFSAGLAGSTR